MNDSVSHSSRQRGKPHFSARVSADLVAYLKLGRFHSPSGALYLLLPCWWGIALASMEVSDWQADALSTRLVFVLLFALAAFVARAAGCAWNDLLDYDIDKKTARTQTRPLPSGALSKRQALLFVVLSVLVCGVCLLVLLALAANPVLLLLLVCAVLPVAAFYPLAKRIFSVPQVVLGVAFNWGILCASTAVEGSVSVAALTLWLGAVAWTTFYDTVYAWQDIEDDRRTKMKSLTLWLEKKRNPKLWLAALYAFFLASVFLALCLKSGENERIVLVALVALVALALWCYADLRRRTLGKPQDCMAFFRTECWRTGGGIVVLLLVATFV